MPAIAINSPTPDDKKEENNNDLDFAKVGQSHQ
jgi:hypothetical protein